MKLFLPAFLFVSLILTGCVGPDRPIVIESPKVERETHDAVEIDKPKPKPAAQPKEEEAKPVAVGETDLSIVEPVIVPTENVVPVEVFTEEEKIAYEAERAQAIEVQEANESLAEEPTMQVVGAGTFIGIAPGHNSSGSLLIKQNGDKVVIELGEDFDADQGPDLYVTLSQMQSFSGEDPVQLDTSKIRTVSPLARQAGKQVYTLPLSDFEAYGDVVVIWCQKYNVVFGYALVE